jgi:flagellar assembly protein FliH
MKSSSSVLKQPYVRETTESKEIITRQIVKKSKEDNDDLWLKDGRLNPHTAKIPPEKLTEFQAIQEKITSQAQKAAEKLKQKGYQEGYTAGKEAGYQDGYQQGSKEGRLLAEKLTNQAKQNFQNSLTRANQYTTDKQNEIVTFAVKMAEILIKKELDLEPAVIKEILKTMLLKIKKTDQMLIIRAHPRYHQQLEKQLRLEKKNLPNLRYLILDDFDKSEYQVTVETDGAILSFDLARELERFLQQAKN